MVNLTDWQTRFGPVNKTVTQLVTPKVVVCDSYESNMLNLDLLLGVWKASF